MTHASDLRRIADEMDRLAVHCGGRSPTDDAVTLRQAADALEAREWVKCSERLPESFVDVVVFTTDGGELLAWFDPYLDAWNQYGREEFTPIHWMPLPLPPEPEPTDAAR